MLRRKLTKFLQLATEYQVVWQLR